MALHTQLPIYKVAYDLFNFVLDLAKNMPRDFKALIGTKLRDECTEIMNLIFRANCAQDKSTHLVELIERLQVTELFLRVSRDKRLISTIQYAKAVEITSNLGKQANGWRSAKAAHSPVSQRSRPL
jgi:hypothetical protein